MGLLDRLVKDNPELQQKLNEIDAYWDKKTLFVHRRALVTGVILGFFLGVWVVVLVSTFYIAL